MLKRSPYLDEVRAETGQKYTIDVLKRRFPGAVPPALEDQIKAEMDLDKVEQRHVLAVTTDSVEAFEANRN